MFRLARAWLSPTGALAASVLYAANPYQFVLAYVRSDFAELLAAAFFPLAIHFMLRCGPDAAKEAADGTNEALRNAVSLAVVYAVIWLANAPAAVIASYALAFLLLLSAVLRRSVRPLLEGFAALALGSFLAAFYIVPAAYERLWVNIAEINSAGFLPAENFLFIRILDPEHNLVNLEISAIAVLVIALTGIAAVVSHRRALRTTFVWGAMISLAALSVFLMFPASDIAWRYLPELRFLQFPWRWLLVVAVCFAFFLGEVVGTSPRKRIITLALAAVLVGTGIFAARITYWDSDDLDDVVAAVAAGQGYDGTYEYCPLACDPARLPENAAEIVLSPKDEVASAGATRKNDEESGIVSVRTWEPEYKVFDVEAPIPAHATVRLLNYPAWRIRVNGVLTTPSASEGTQQMIVPLPAGKSRVEIRFARTSDRTIGGALSGVAVLLVSALSWFGWRRPKENTS